MDHARDRAPGGAPQAPDRSGAAQARPAPALDPSSGGQPVGERYRTWLGRAFAVGQQEHLLNPVRPGELGEGFALRGFAGAVEQVNVAVLQRLQRSDPRQFDKFELAVRLFGQGAEQHKLTAGELPVTFVDQRIPLFPADAQAAVLPQGQPGGDEQQAAEQGAECAHD